MPGPGWPNATRDSTFEPNNNDWNAIADAPHNWPGDVNGGGNNLNAVLNLTGTGALTMTGQPVAFAYNSVNLSIPNAAWSTLTFDTNGTGTIAVVHSTSLNISRFIATLAGCYLMQGQVAFASNSTGLRYARILLNGSAVLAEVDLNAVNGDTHFMQISRLAALLNVNDYIEFQVYQTSGVSLNAIAGFGNTYGSLVKLL